MGQNAEIPEINIHLMKFISTVILLLSLSLSVSGCVSLPGTVTDYTDGYFFDNVSLRPGTVAWSPDARSLAIIIKGKLIIFDTESGEVRKIPDITPSFIDWAPGAEMLVIHNSGNRSNLAQLNTIDETYKSVPIETEAIAVRWLRPPDRFVTLSTDVKRLTIGTFVAYRLSTHNSGENIFFRWDAYFPTRQTDFDYLSNWTHLGVRPIYETILTPQFHKPPVVHPYTEFITVDPVTSLESKILRLDAKRFNVPASWSPDGSRLAVSDDRGLLVIVDVATTDRVEQVSLDIRGDFPSWNPEGSQIYIGGWLMQSDGTAIREVLPDAVDSLGVWSPDGTKLAVLSKGRLHIIDHFSPMFIVPDSPMDTDKLKLRDKFRLLKDLFKSRLISDSEFNFLKTKLFKSSEEDK
jgi:hypothetical protein